MVAVRTPRYNVVFERFSGRLAAWDWASDYQERRDLWAVPKDVQRREIEALRTTLDKFQYRTYRPDAVGRQHARRGRSQ
jgi:hypothetical protein